MRAPTLHPCHPHPQAVLARPELWADNATATVSLLDLARLPHTHVGCIMTQLRTLMADYLCTPEGTPAVPAPHPHLPRQRWHRKVYSGEGGGGAGDGEGQGGEGEKGGSGEVTAWGSLSCEGVKSRWGQWHTHSGDGHNTSTGGSSGGASSPLPRPLHKVLVSGLPALTEIPALREFVPPSQLPAVKVAVGVAVTAHNTLIQASLHRLQRELAMAATTGTTAAATYHAASASGPAAGAGEGGALPVPALTYLDLAGETMRLLDAAPSMGITHLEDPCLSGGIVAGAPAGVNMRDVRGGNGEAAGDGVGGHPTPNISAAAGGDHTGQGQGGPGVQKCEDPGSYFFYDAIHPTARIHSMSADTICALLLG